MINKYKCLICGCENNNHKNHLNFKHNISFEKYFELYKNEINIYNEYLLKNKEYRQSLSPNSILFYIKKGYSELESKKLLNEYQNNNPFKKAINRKSSIEYWTNKGYSFEEAKLKQSENQRNNLETRIEKHGKENGTLIHNKYINKLKERKNIFIYNLINNENLNYEEAINKFKNSKILNSIRRVEYWINKNYSLEESKQKVSEFQKEITNKNSKYWIKKGYSENEAKELISKLQKINNIKSIQERYGFNIKEAFKYQKEIYDKMIKTKIFKGIILSKNEKNDFEIYKGKVLYFTKFSWKFFYKDILNKQNTIRSKQFHLDHRLSIFEGFKKGILPIYVGSPYNLELLNCSENCSKSFKSSIKEEDLFNTFNIKKEYIQWIL